MARIKSADTLVDGVRHFFEFLAGRRLDPTEPGGSMGRIDVRASPAFSMMLSRLKKGHAIDIVIHKIDHSTRNLADWVERNDSSVPILAQLIRLFFLHSLASGVACGKFAHLRGFTPGILPSALRASALGALFKIAPGDLFVSSMILTLAGLLEISFLTKFL